MISCVLLTKKENTVSKLGDNRMEEEVRWKPVSDMTAWVHCPMGMCPGQTIQACMFDLPKDSLRNYDCEGKSICCLLYSCGIFCISRVSHQQLTLLCRNLLHGRLTCVGS